MTPEENKLMMHVGPGTPLGKYLRTQWMPALRSARVEAGGTPVKSRLLGEDFVVFRRADGQVGFISEACPHRGVSMALARNDGHTLQCLFHGWKMDTKGCVAECPNVPNAEKFAAGVKTRYFPVVETGNMIWVYLGGDEAPPFPKMLYNQDPHALPHGAIVHCNWLQLMEGTLDPNHVAFLHANWLPKMAVDMFLHEPARYEMVDQPYGFTGCSIRSVAEGISYARAKEIIMPYAMDLPTEPESASSTIVSVPIDDDTTYFWYVMHTDPGLSGGYSEDRMERVKGAGAGATEEDLFWLGVDSRPGAPRNRDNFRHNFPYDPQNNWGQDRAAMKKGHVTGYPGLIVEDIAVTESMGKQVDRSRETLNVTDAFVVRFRRILLQAIKDTEEGNKPVAIDFTRVKGREGMVPEGKSWKDLPHFRNELRLMPPLPRLPVEPMQVS